MICSTKAVVLRSFDFRETSKIAVFFTEEFGKITGILKGIRKNPRKFGSTLPLLSLNQVLYYKKRDADIYLVGQCDLLERFDSAGDEIYDLASRSIACELIDKIMLSEDVNRPIFGLTLNFLESLKTHTKDMRHIFQIKILSFSGFKPHFDTCLICSKKILKGAYFSYPRGGLLCSDCVWQDPSAHSILKGTIATILFIERSSFKDCLRLAIHGQIKNEIKMLLDRFIHFHVAKVMKAERLASQLMAL